MTNALPKKRAIFLAVALAVFSSVFADEPPKNADSTDIQDTSFRVSQENTYSILNVILPQHSLRNSKTLHNWPFFAFSLPSVSSTFKLEKDFGKMLTIGSNSAGDLSFLGLSLHSQLDLKLVKLLTLGVKGTMTSAWNYWETTLMGVYNPGKKKYRQDTFLTQFSYGVNYNAKVTIPIMAFLPKSKWTKVLLNASGSLDYTAYTGAEDKEAWIAGSEIRANGYKMQYGGSLIYILPFKHWYMAMVSAGVSGFLHDSDFDNVYADYDPSFKTISITPMAMFKLNENWKGIFITIISRDRDFEDGEYKYDQELMQKRNGTIWGPRIIAFIASRKF